MTEQYTEFWYYVDEQTYEEFVSLLDATEDQEYPKLKALISRPPVLKEDTQYPNCECGWSMYFYAPTNTWNCDACGRVSK